MENLALQHSHSQGPLHLWGYSPHCRVMHNPTWPEPSLSEKTHTHISLTSNTQLELFSKEGFRFLIWELNRHLCIGRIFWHKPEQVIEQFIQTLCFPKVHRIQSPKLVESKKKLLADPIKQSVDKNESKYNR